jgi:hypothetical protein
MKRDPEFGAQVRSLEEYFELTPLQAIYQAANDNWRAATWLLERKFPKRYTRPRPSSGLGKPQARQLLLQVLQIVEEELIDPAGRARIERRIRAAFEYAAHVYCEPNRNPRGLNQAIALFEQIAGQGDVCTRLGISMQALIEGLTDVSGASAAPAPPISVLSPSAASDVRTDDKTRDFCHAKLEENTVKLDAADENRRTKPPAFVQKIEKHPLLDKTTLNSDKTAVHRPAVNL